MDLFAREPPEPRRDPLPCSLQRGLQQTDGIGHGIPQRPIRMMSKLVPEAPCLDEYLSLTALRSLQVAAVEESAEPTSELLLEALQDPDRVGQIHSGKVTYLNTPR